MYDLPIDAYVLPLTNGYAALVSPEDFERCAERKWYAHLPSRDNRYVYAHTPRRRADGTNGTMYLHRFILGVEDCGNGVVVDHEDGDTLNCLRSNLRAGDYVLNNNNRYYGRTAADMGAWRRRIRREATTRTGAPPLPSVAELLDEPDPIVAGRPLDPEMNETGKGRDRAPMKRYVPKTVRGENVQARYEIKDLPEPAARALARARRHAERAAKMETKAIGCISEGLDYLGKVWSKRAAREWAAASDAMEIHASLSAPSLRLAA